MLQDIVGNFQILNVVFHHFLYMFCFPGVFAGSMIRRFGTTKTILAGTLMSCTGLLATSFTTSIHSMYVTYGILPGFGFVMMALSSLVAVNEIFDEQQSLAIGIYQAGGSVGGFVFNPVLQSLIESYEWRGALLIMTGIVLHGALFGLVIHAFGRPSRGALTESQRYNERDSKTIRDCNGEYKPFIDKHQFHIDSLGSVTLIVKQPPAHNDDIDENVLVTSVCDNKIIDKSKMKVVKVSEEKQAKSEDLSSEYLKTELTNGIDILNRITDNETVPNGKLTKFLAVFHQIFPYKVFGHLPTSIFVIAAGIRAFGFFVPFLLLADFAVDKGITVEGAAWLASAVGISGAVSRVGLGWVGDFPCVDRLYLYILCLIVGGVFSAISPSFSSYGLLMLYACIYGITMGGECSLTPVICSDVAGKSNLAETYGMLQTLCGIGGVCGAPLSGWLFEVTGGYSVSFILTGVFITLSGLVLFPLKCQKRLSIAEVKIVSEA